jgi:peptidyl-prolyl cis-trans isomerase A (cyclophilin A)
MRAIVLMFALMGMGGCNSAQQEAENQRLNLRVQDLEKANARLEKENDALNSQVRKMKEAAAAAEKAAALTALGIGPDAKLSARFDTSKGGITCALWPDKAPLTVANFVGLAEGKKEWKDPQSGEMVKRPLYDGTIFHRVIPEFMSQGGDPLGTGRGGPGYEFEDETSPDVTFSEPGLLAMANAGPDTNGSQFFITDRATPHHLDGKHTIFGKCGNLDVVQAIASVDRDGDDRPKTDVVIKKVTITRQ